MRLAERTKAELASHAAAEHSTVRLADRTKQEFPNAVELIENSKICMSLYPYLKVILFFYHISSCLLL